MSTHSRIHSFPMMNIIMSSLLLLILLSANVSNAFVVRRSFANPRPFVKTAIGYRSVAVNADEQETATEYDDSAPLAVDRSFYEADPLDVLKPTPLSIQDPSLVEIVPSEDYQQPPAQDLVDLEEMAGSHYPYAAMLQTAAPYIAAHAGQIAVFHLPGDLLEQDDNGNVISDMALAWLLGMKIVLVVGCRYDMDTCDLDLMENPHECHNALKITDADTLRRVEEEAGYLRTEVERKLNRKLKMQGGVPSTPENPAPDGNVVSGNFYTAKQFGIVQGQDYEYTGCVSQVHTENIEQVLDNNDVVMLTTVGYSSLGELVNVNGYHLAASVASALDAYKLVYMANEGSVLKKKNENEPVQELPLSFARAFCDFHNVQVHNTGFATFEQARQALEPRATELLLHLAWSAWALENGVQRAHIVNPGDGTMLEELFTSKNGANTCLYHDDERIGQDDDVTPEDWADFFSAAAEQGQETASFN